MGRWDRGVDFETMYVLITRKMKLDKRSRCYFAILLTQLRNGARVSEAVRAFQTWLRSGRAEVEVKVSKRKDVVRLIVIPTEVLDMKAECVELAVVNEKKLVERLKVFAKRRLGVNTHSLRYAFITYLLRQGVSPAIVAKITQHAKLDHILTYTQQKAAEDLLRRLV
ncbi:MAG: integrase [Pyrobaculum sp.]